MNAVRTLILVAFVAILAVPFFLTRDQDLQVPKGSQRLVIITPHIEQIRLEFARGFDRWHRRTYGEPVEVDFRAAGGTTEILQLLTATYSAALNRQLADIRAATPERLLDPALNLAETLKPGSADFDLMMGGGTFDHDRLRSRGVTVTSALPPGQGVKTVTLARPRERLDPRALDQLRDLETDANWEGRTLRLRIPVSAITGGAGALSPLAAEGGGGAKTVDVPVNLDQALRLFTVRISAPPEPLFAEADLDRVFGENKLGAGKLWQDDRGKLVDGKRERPADWQHWFGTALSGFGLVYNRDRVKELGVPEPQQFQDLTRPEFANQLALADPRQSGSVATAYDSILNEAARRGVAEAKARGATEQEGLAEGWRNGWRTLYEMAANARYFTSASTQPPMDVSQGEAAAGVAIDFYGRGQAQAILQPGQKPSEGRMGYVDPPGAVYIDADPVSILRGAPKPTLARRFVEYCLTDEAQALWQFPPVGLDGNSPEGQSNPPIPGAKAGERLGPTVYRLRRLPALRSFYDQGGPYWPFLADQVDPFALASTATTQGWRDGMIVMFGCWVDVGDDLKRAWAALCAARADKAFPPDRLAEMERLFYAMPTHTLATGDTVEFNLANYRRISDDVRRWNDPKRGVQARISYTRFFRENLRQVAAMGPG